MAVSCIHLHSIQLLPWLLWWPPDRSPTSRAALLQSVCYTAARMVTARRSEAMFLISSKPSSDFLMFLEEKTKISIRPQGALCPDLHILLTSVQVAPAVLLVLNPWPAQGEVMLTSPTVWDSNSADICMTFRVYLWTGVHSTETEFPLINSCFIFLYNIHLHLMNLQVYKFVFISL